MSTSFLTRPEIRGHFGVAAATHWLAAQTAMSILERGGNAFDAACAAGFVLQVAEPHLNGPGGDVPILCYRHERRESTVICGQGPAPAAATIDAVVGLGIDLIPGTGLLPAVVPGAFDAWLTLLLEHGTLEPRAVLEPAVAHAARGVPVLPRMHLTLGAIEPVFRRDWPDSAALYLSRGVPPAGGLLRNEVLADTWRRLLDEIDAVGGNRERRIETARRTWSQGFIAEAIDAYCRRATVRDISGGMHGALLRGEDLAGWRAPIEAPLVGAFGDLEVLKCGPWSQGPVQLQCLSMLSFDEARDLVREPTNFVHTLAEITKLAMADRETFYGDPDFVEVPLDILLSPGYAATRRSQIGDTASDRFQPGAINGFGRVPDFDAACARRKLEGVLSSYGAGEPTMAEVVTGDTCYVCVADRHGNLVSATPSGGWLQSSPVIPELGFCLGTRGQTFWLDPVAPNALMPGKRPRTTLTPTMVLRDGEGFLACGTPGGDQQEQWQFQFLLRHLCQGLDMQSALDAPAFHVEQWPSSFYPRQATPQRLAIEPRFGAEVHDALAARGHRVEYVEDWSEGRMAACRREKGELYAAASPRGQQVYAVGR